MSRVLHVYSGNLFGGVEALLLTLAEADPSPVQSEFALCYDGRLRRGLIERGAHVHALGEVRLRQPFSVLRARRNLRALITHGGYDAVVCHSVWAQVLFAPTVRASRRPLGLWLHDVATGRHWLERLARRVPPDLIVANSHFTASTLEHLYPGLPPLVLHCPVARPERDWLPERAAVRQEVGSSSDRVLIVQVGRMDPLKGHAVLLDACAELAGDDRWECWIAGGSQRPQETQYLAGLVQRAAKLGLSERVRFLGERHDVPRLLAAADIFCQPNVRPEAFGIAIVEAMHAGLPVVASRLGGAVESLAGGIGVLVESGNAHTLAAELRRLLDDEGLRKALGARGPERAKELCDPPQQLERLESALLDLARRGAATAMRGPAASAGQPTTRGIPPGRARGMGA